MAKQRQLHQTTNDFHNNSQLILDELLRATELYGPINSMHEGYGIIKEELDEFWDEVRANRTCKAREELIQIAAMCYRLLQDSQHWRGRGDT